MAVAAALAPVLVGGAIAVGTASTPAGASGPASWTVSESYPSPTTSIDAVACASTTACVAVGSDGSGDALTSADGGDTWTTASIPSTVYGLTGLACPSASVCVAVGYGATAPVVLTSGDGGATWTAQSPPASASSLNAVTCTSTSDCVAVGDEGDDLAVLATTDGGADWTPASVPTLDGELRAVACPSPSDCYASGQLAGVFPSPGPGVVLATTDGGNTWTSETIPNPTGELAGIACASTTVCVAVGSNESGSALIDATTDGTDWTNEVAPSSLSQLAAVACPSTTVCEAVGTETSPTPGGSASPGTDVAASVDGGSTWAVQSTPGDVVQLNAVACPSATTCVAGGDTPYLAPGSQPTIGHVIETTDTGTTWSDSQPLPGLATLNAITCVSAEECVAVGQEAAGSPTEPGAVIYTTDGGATWMSGVLPSDADLLSSVACPSATECFAMAYSSGSGSILLTSTDGGALWATVSLTLPSIAESITCASAAVCLIPITASPSGIDVELTTDAGSSWSSASVVTGNASAGGLACPTASDCDLVVSGGSSAEVASTTDGGTTWTTTPLPSSFFAANAIACPSTLVCYVAGATTSGAGQVAVTTDGGGTWSVDPTPSGDEVTALSCPLATACDAVGLAVDTAGPAVALSTTDSGADWTTQDLPDSAWVLSGIDCPMVGTCTAVGHGSGTVGGLILAYDAPVITTPSLPSGQVGTSYSAALAASGGVSPYTYAVTTGSLPPGITLDSATGDLSGTPTSFGTYAFSVTVTDADGESTVSSLSVAVVAAPAGYTPLSPLRICDSRPGNPSSLSGDAAQCNGVAEAGTQLVPGQPLVVSVAGHFGVPVTASAVVVNVTAADETANGYLSLYPAGVSPPTASNLNFEPDTSTATLADVGLGADGQLSVLSNVSTDVIIDLEGYVDSAGGGDLYDALGAPARICDTRPANPSNLTGQAAQCNGAAGAGSPLSSGAPLAIEATGVGGVPDSGVAAVVLNVTVTDAQAAGYLAAYPAGQSAPVASNLNYQAGQTVPNRVIVPVSAAGQVDLVADTATDVVVDVSGWLATAGGTGEPYTAAPQPLRICDTRPGNPSDLSGGAAQCDGTEEAGSPLGPQATTTIQVTGLGDVPADAVAVVLTVTAVDPSSPSFLSVNLAAPNAPTSDLNVVPGMTEANLVIATLSGSGTVTLYNYAGTTNVVVDVAGWYS